MIRAILYDAKKRVTESGDERLIETWKANQGTQIRVNLIEAPRDALMAELSGYKANLKRMRRYLTYHEQMLSQLRAQPEPYFGKSHRHELNDIYEQLERSMSLAGFTTRLPRTSLTAIWRPRLTA